MRALVLMLHTVLWIAIIHAQEPLERAETMFTAVNASDFVAFYYELYRENRTLPSLQNKTPSSRLIVPPIALQQAIPSEIQARLVNLSLEFEALPALMQRALLWDAGYVMGDQQTLAQIYTRCGQSMAHLPISLKTMTAANCSLTLCGNGTSATRNAFASACTLKSLAAMASCASTAVDTTANSSIWRPSPSNHSFPVLRVRRHELADDATHVYAIHTSAATAKSLETNTCDTTVPSLTIPCVPFQHAIDAKWCRPTPSNVMTQWLQEYADQFIGSAPLNNQTRNATSEEEDQVSPHEIKDSFGILVNENFRYDGRSSDLAQQYYRRYRAKDESVGPMVLDGALPHEIQARLTDVSLAFEDLPPLLQRALVWDAGFAYGDGNALASIFVQCGLSMADIAVSKRAFNAAGCQEQNCTTSRRSLYCTGDQMATASLCATTEVSTPVHIAMWADGGTDDMVPDVAITRHAWEDRNQSYLIYGIHTTRNEPAYSQCPETGSIIIPCVPYNESAHWCRPKPGVLVSSWLKQVAKDKQFNLLYLIPILLAVAFVTTAIGICIRRKSSNGRWRRKFQFKPEETMTTMHQDHATSRHGSFFVGSSLREWQEDDRCSSTTASGAFIRRRSHDLQASRLETMETRSSSISSSSSSTSDMLISSMNSIVNSLVTNPLLQQRRIPYEQLQWQHMLSKGAHGEVWLATFENEPVAVKRLLKKAKAQFDAIESFTAEILLTASLSHPNIIQFRGVSWNSLQNLALITEYVERGDLQTFLKQSAAQQISWQREKWHIALGIAEALRYLHRRQPVILHRDLKSKNVLLTRTLDAKLIDFGVSRNKIEDVMTAGVGTPYWTAPEILQGELYSEKADIYSFGVILSELDTRQTPYSDLTTASGKKAVLQPLQILQQVIAGTLRPTFSPQCPHDIADLALDCLQRNPSDRPCANEVIAALTQLPVANFDSSTFSF